jgi:phenylacetic acid degradation protein
MFLNGMMNSPAGATESNRIQNLQIDLKLCIILFLLSSPPGKNMPSYTIDGIIPVVDPAAFVHPTAVLIGDVIIAPGCYVGPNAVLRGDFGRIIMHAGANLQDTCVVHTFPNMDCVVETDGHIGHGAVLHGCHIGRNALVGMNAVVMDEALIGEESIVGAGAFVKSGFSCPRRSLVAGSPAKILRELKESEVRWKSQGTAVYHELVGRCFDSLREVEPLAEPEASRRRVEFSPLKLKKDL